MKQIFLDLDLKHQYSFLKDLYQDTEDFLGLNLEEIGKMDTSTALAYIEANQLFYDCLQVATVEDREEIEDMILKAPDDNE